MKEFPINIRIDEETKIMLSRERWAHITSRHGELVDLVDEVVKTVKEPQKVLKQPEQNEKHFYFRKSYNLRLNNYICVVVIKKENFIVTAYPTRKIKV